MASFTAKGGPPARLERAGLYQRRPESRNGRQLRICAGRPAGGEVSTPPPVRSWTRKNRAGGADALHSRYRWILGKGRFAVAAGTGGIIPESLGNDPAESAKPRVGSVPLSTCGKSVQGASALSRRQAASAAVRCAGAACCRTAGANRRRVDSAGRIPCENGACRPRFLVRRVPAPRQLSPAVPADPPLPRVLRELTGVLAVLPEPAVLTVLAVLPPARPDIASSDRGVFGSAGITR